MVSRILKAVIPVGLLVASTVVMADGTPAAPASPPPPPPPPPLVINAQVGYVDAHGTSDAQTANAKFDLTYTYEEWKHFLQLQGLYGTSDSIVSAERLDAQWQSNYNFTNRLYAFGALHYLDDKFSGFQYQETVSTGIGYNIFKQADFTLDAQAGVGYRRLRPELIDQAPDGEVISRTPLNEEGNVVATAMVKGMYAFNASTKIIDTLQAESGSDNTMIQNDLGLQVNMSKSLAITAGYEVVHNSDPPAGLPKTDTLLTFNLTYAFPAGATIAGP